MRRHRRPGAREGFRAHVRRARRDARLVRLVPIGLGLSTAGFAATLEAVWQGWAAGIAAIPVAVALGGALALGIGLWAALADREGGGPDDRDDGGGGGRPPPGPDEPPWWPSFERDFREHVERSGRKPPRRPTPR